jgi:diadenosine tetraphosphate (Ap4A) HIT family hydrolase
LPLGTLVVKPERHLLHVADLSADEAAELGPLLRATANVVTDLASPEQVYVCLWSHGPVHIHFVVQPTDASGSEPTELHGPALQAAMFARKHHPERAAVEQLAARARTLFART